MFLLIPLKTSKDLPFFIRSSHQMCSVKKGVLKILFNSEENTCIEASLDKVSVLRPATLLKRRLSHSCFPVNFCEILRTSFSQIFCFMFSEGRIEQKSLMEN